MKLTIETTVTQKKILDIQIPCFVRTKNQKEYYAVLDEKTMVKLLVLDTYINITNTEFGTYEKNQFAEAWGSELWTSCTEMEFLEKYDSVIESISLHPKLAV